MSTHIDLTLPPEAVDLSLWIGVGKEYCNVPEAIANELKSRISLSDTSRSMLPPPRLTISELLATQLPPEATTWVLKDARAAFCNIPANTPLSYLLLPNRPLPPRPFLIKLRNAAGQAMLDGSVSIKHWGAHDIYLPFEALGLWYALSDFVKAQTAWKTALRWTANVFPHDNSSRTARMTSIFQSLHWEGLIPKLGRASEVTHMAQFLSSSSLSSSHIDAMLLRLRARYRDEVDHRSSKQILLVPTLSFTDHLGALASKDTQSPNEILDSSELSRIGNFIATSPQDVLIATVGYWPTNHWGFVLITISGSRVQAKWGDGLQRKVPKALAKGIRMWSNLYLPKHIVTIDSGYTCASQNDGYSCGIVALNALKYHIFRDTLWTGATKEQLRMNEFLSCMEFCKDNDTVDPPLIPLLPLLEPPISLTPAPVVAPQPTKRPRGNSKAIATPGTSPVTSPTSSPSRVMKRPRRGSKLNLNTQIAPILALGATLPEGDSPMASDDNQLDLPLSRVKKVDKSRSTLSKQRNNAAATDGSFEQNKIRWEAYVKKLRTLDPYVEVYEGNPKKIRDVRCSWCTKDIKQSEPYNTYRFKQHISRCKFRGSKLHTKSIAGMLTLGLSRSSALNLSKPKQGKLCKRPCSGLTEAHDDRIPQYTSRTEVRHAGGLSRPSLALKYFGQPFPSLSQEQKDEVDLHYRNSCQWELDHDNGRVFSCKCIRVVWCQDSEGLKACTECLSILRLRAFQVSISREGAPDDQRKYIPSRYQSVVTGKMYATNKGLGKLVKETASKKGDFLLEFTVALSSGAFDGKPSFIQLMEVMLERHKRQERGVGLQNMQYATDFDQFCHEIQCVRPEAYRLFSSTFGGRSERSMLRIRASKPKMTVGISEATLQRAVKYLGDYDYPSTSPLACAVDDTKLHPSLRPYYDQSKKTWFLLGSTTGPMIVADPDQLDQLIHQASDSLATKARVWSLSIPLSNVPPLVMAILPISESNTAASLATIEESLLKLLLIDSPTPINIISLGSDGTVIERKARRLLIESGFAAVEYTSIQHPSNKERPLKVELLCIGTHRLAIIQDSKHFRKTCRNNLFTGAKQLVLGNQLIYYEQVRSMVYDQNRSPLYVRDVDKLDRQDDRAAARLFSAANIKHAIESGHTGLAIFLFVFGEAVDAYQSRTITHGQRIRMVLLAYFFKTIWKDFLAENGYPSSRHYISQEADDILDILVNGLLGLIIIHRDHLSSPFPLLPWMHGSEANEHIFGLLRSTLPEFTIVDAIQIIPKLDVRLMAACQRTIEISDFRRGGAGYTHTHFDGSGANLDTLSSFPPRETFEQIAGIAWIEANAIWEVLGYYRGLSPTPSLPLVPVADLDADEDDLLDAPAMGDKSLVEEVSDRAILDQALQAASFVSVAPSNHPDLSDSVMDTLNDCGLAAAALNMRDLAALDDLADEKPEALAEIQAALKPILAAISALGTAGQAAVNDLLKQASEHPSGSHVHTKEEDQLEDPPSNLSQISEYDIGILVDERWAHQSKETTDTCRPVNLSDTSPNEEEAAPVSARVEDVERTPRQLLAQKIHEVLRLSGINVKGETSGLARQFRWTKQAMTTTDKDATGNAVNARIAASSRANVLINSRKSIFASLPLTDVLATANITHLFQLIDGLFAIVLYEKKLMLGQVVTFYEKGGGKASTHSWVSNASSVGNISWISMQVWTPLSTPNLFRSITQSGVPKYGLVHSKAFLYALTTKAVTIRGDSFIKLAPAVYNSVFRPLNAKEGLVVEAVKKLMGKKHTYELEDLEG
ncbi:hypothetical protein PC9H_011232 [Pleurotus ostreatus]|uniref:Ubiquitin-like protease family profile domain-containing protein n=1 Tax=Pleurotus ostreatus TaxID=5322 RepID=A0A8H6ZIC4_PLEOS|nr:uncharacterized protein PC9H_011232 [Pleurotus ostreatus]KAF7420714.1 hypothetical protein PC9H_011232 [Pleurotus ostreatus]